MPRILVVDDDPLVCKALEVCLARHDFLVTIAEGGESGLRALEGASFDVMIVDIFMPHMRGFESIRIFHERAPSVALIAMSGYAFANADPPAPDFLRMALELGATRCLRKPFTPVALMTAINECLAEGRGATPASPGNYSKYFLIDEIAGSRAVGRDPRGAAKLSPVSVFVRSNTLTKS